MIVTVTLNAAVDKTYRIPGFCVDRIHRPLEWRVEAGGKGVNVARVFRTLGGEAVATGFLGGYNGRYVAKALEREGIEGHFVRTTDESRICIAAVDPDARTQTEINEPGPCVSAAEICRLTRRIDRLLAARTPDFIVFSGSTTPGVPDDVYQTWIELAREHGVRALLDASGEPLRCGLRARPWMVKPNVHELGDALGCELIEVAEVVGAARAIVDDGVEVVAVTLGRQGAILVCKEGVWSADAPEIDFVSAVGSGDSFVAAFVRSVELGLSMPEALRWGVGAGTANATVYGAGFCSRDLIAETASRVRVEAS